jgi:hypothetical protein
MSIEGYAEARKKYDEMLEKFKKEKEQFFAAAKNDLSALLVMEMEHAPASVHGFRWRQYTPSFNDGDPCVFEVHSPELIDEHGGEISFYEAYEWTSDRKKIRAKGATDEQWSGFEFSDRITKLIESQPEEMLEDVYGNGSTVTVTRSGVDVEEYYDY